MKAILISIKPKYVADILNHKKTIEVRKSMPKCDLPIDVYIYCTKDKKSKVFGFADRYPVDFITSDRHRGTGLSGYVVAKFTLNKVEEINRYCTGKGISYKTETLNDIELCDKSCLDLIEIDHYLYFKKGYAWHISNLEIFDKPKELSEFYPYCKDEKCEYRKNHCSICYRKPLTEAPQSMCYIEVEE